MRRRRKLSFVQTDLDALVKLALLKVVSGGK
jgi:hypothetical protein